MKNVGLCVSVRKQAITTSFLTNIGQYWTIFSPFFRDCFLTSMQCTSLPGVSVFYMNAHRIMTVILILVARAARVCRTVPAGDEPVTVDAACMRSAVGR